MVADRILALIDETIVKVQRGNGSPAEAATLYEKLGRECARLRRNSIAFRKSERRKGQRIRQQLQAKQ